MELALTLTGVSKSERKKRAEEALKAVGLENQLHKRPSEMSGGQMQRVAIARALVNNPDIILADEPTGALDTETSVQVMDILKDVAKDRLVIMVTHNPDLAEKYSTRIIRMLDGLIIDDSMPLSSKECQDEFQKDEQTRKNSKNAKKPSMSVGTSFGLSLRNLVTKKGRTILTTFAGSIGIIGIALVLAVSQGFTAYIDDIQEETLSSYPLTIQKTNSDLSNVMQTFMDSATSLDVDHENDAVYKKSAVYEMMNALSDVEVTETDLKEFKDYLETERADEEGESGFHDSVSGVQYGYDLDLLIYTRNIDGTIIRSDARELFEELMAKYMGTDMSSMLDSSSSLGDLSSLSSLSKTSNLGVWQEMLPGDDGELISDVLKDQYDVVYGDWPTAYNELVLVLDENNELDDISLYTLGLESENSMKEVVEAAINDEEADIEHEQWSYQEICDMEFMAILNSNCYSYDESTGLYTDLRDTDAGIQYLYDNGVPLKIVGIIRPNEDTIAPMLTGSIAYTSKLTEYVIGQAEQSEAIQAQLSDEHTDILTGLPFRETTGVLTNSQKEQELRTYIDGLDQAGKAQMYVSIMSVPSDEQLSELVSQATQGVTREQIEETLVPAIAEQTGMAEEQIKAYIASMSDDELFDTYAQAAAEQVKAQYAAAVQEQMSAMEPAQLAAALDMAMDGFTSEQWSLYYDNVIEFSDSTYENNLTKMGYIDLDAPSTINLYASTFEDKDNISDAIERYNEGKPELEQIQYTDYIGMMMSSMTTIINTITYVLIAFVAISLVVSSIMIAVITLISVQERTKEIGILRAIGASKKDVSGMFNAETIIIGFGSGLFGVLFTYLLCIPINLILHHLTGLGNLSAFLPVSNALVLVLISVLLTLIAGIIPSRSASKKDPVVALRTE